MKLRPVLNPDSPPTGDMFKALNWLETRCRMRGVASLAEDEVVQFLAEEEGRIDLAKAFNPSFLLPDVSQ